MSRGRAVLASGSISEAAFQAQVLGLARFYGWRPFHAPDGGHAPRAGGRRVAGGQIPEGRGFPDLLLIRDYELVCIELKTDTGRLGPGQQEWLDAFNTVGGAIDAAAPARVEAFLWRPRDMETIHARLAAGRVRQEWTW